MLDGGKVKVTVFPSLLDMFELGSLLTVCFELHSYEISLMMGCIVHWRLKTVHEKDWRRKLPFQVHKVRRLTKLIFRKSKLEWSWNQSLQSSSLLSRRVTTVAVEHKRLNITCWKKFTNRTYKIWTWWNCVGIVPSRLFPAKCNLRKGIAPNSVGIVPSNLLSFRNLKDKNVSQSRFGHKGNTNLSKQGSWKVHSCSQKIGSWTGNVQLSIREASIGCGNSSSNLIVVQETEKVNRLLKEGHTLVEIQRVGQRSGCDHMALDLWTDCGPRSYSISTN